ncbi:Putative nuclease HARBI1 [Trachymyrmex zeteki]|uniref:Putative nuclease HARBI1 n=1 Tax=Mycetomoellerius zeteki TaxID=64791 RepID=A0A151WPQ6_9HYME|nr:Putative nuclease HARBI1 [Trachymyrmex zeteki]
MFITIIHCISLQICDWRLKIMNINARYCGSTHDAYIWNNSNVKNAMIHLYRRYSNNNFYLVGDSGYSLRPWMMTPIIDAPENSPEAAYNKKQMKVRSLIQKIIYTCAVLHNLETR